MATCNPWWCNCALEADAEILVIDELEKEIAPLSPAAESTRQLIASFELCHHKADRWLDNIIDAIGSDSRSTKGLGTRSAEAHHPAEDVWRNACAALSAWCAGTPVEAVDVSVGDTPAADLLASLEGKRSPLREWQVQRVIQRIRSLTRWPPSDDDPSTRYVWILYTDEPSDSMYRSECPEQFREHGDFWLATARTIIRDSLDGEAAALSLGIAIDMLWPCHWRFVDNLKIVLDAIGGKLEPETPFAACGRNIALTPLSRRVETLSGTLRAFCGESEHGVEVDRDILTRLGEPTKESQWLAASLDKTLRLQLDTPESLRAISALTGPDWLAE